MLTSVDRKKAFLTGEISSYEEVLYSQGVRARAAKHVGDKQLEEACIRDIERITKFIDFFTAELKGLSRETKQCGEFSSL